jgi:hypothetical protein
MARPRRPVEQSSRRKWLLDHELRPAAELAALSALGSSVRFPCVPRASIPDRAAAYTAGPWAGWRWPLDRPPPTASPGTAGRSYSPSLQQVARADSASEPHLAMDYHAAHELPTCGTCCSQLPRRRAPTPATPPGRTWSTCRGGWPAVPYLRIASPVQSSRLQ